MLKKLMLVAGAALALIAVSAPVASAGIFDNGVALKAGQNPEVTASGSASFTSPNGNVICATGAHTVLQLTGGTTNGHVKSFGTATPGACHVTGGLSFLGGGTNSLTKVELTGNPAVLRVGNTLTVTNIVLHNYFSSGLKITLTSTAEPARDVVATPNAPLSKPTTFSLGGTLLADGLNSNVTIDGDLTIAGPTYGFE